MMKKKYLKESLEGDNIILKRHEISFAQKMFEYVCKDKERLSRFLPWPPHIKTVDDEIKFIEESNETWDRYASAGYGIFRKKDKEYLGNIGAFNFNWNHERCEIGYWILGDFEGKGYMREAVQALEDELFLIGFNRIVIMCDKENQRSKKIPSSLGYTFEGSLRDLMKTNEKYVTLEVHSKLRKDCNIENLK
ncbi:MAG: GNAT family protein [Bacteroidales bacterium]|jgi:ribosomal-protein-serine acetyltransferase|nr:GNAT family protein [Bacteroidales bacterium]